jgi:hypothetical protein
MSCNLFRAKQIFLLFLFFFLFLTFPYRTFSNQDFLVSFDVVYTVSENGTTHAVFNGTLQNTSSSYYASSYTLQTGFDAIKNIAAYDQNGTITPDIEKSDSGSAIVLHFGRRLQYF